MNVVSVNVGLPRELRTGGGSVVTGIFKTAAPGRVRVRALNLDGDGQADLRAHGGPFKAVYAYPGEHYAFWAEQFPGTDLLPGAFGENLTLAGCLEDAIHIGDRLRIGSAEVLVTQPRLPCYKLGIRLGRADAVDRFLASGRSGFYCAVAREGDVAAGDAVEVVARDPHRVSVADVAAAFAPGGVWGDPASASALLRRAVQTPALPEAMRRRLMAKLAELDWGV